MKKIYFILLLTLLPLMASADVIESGGIYYNLNSDYEMAIVISHPNKYSGDIVIPKSVLYGGVTYPVKWIGNNAFENCTGLTSVSIPNSMTQIGNYSFLGCTGLTSVIIPNSVTQIGIYAFEDCSALTSVSISNSITSISDNAFWGCSGLTSLTLPNGMTNIGRFAFYKCTGLTSLTIPSSVTSIGEHAFSYCTGLTSIKVESGNTVYDSRDNCNAVIETTSNTLVVGCKNSTIPNSVTCIGDRSFSGCSGLTSITIPNGVTSIGAHAFYECTGLTSVNVPNNVTVIRADAFYGCSNLTTIAIGSGVKTISDYAFSSCTSLTEVYCLAEDVPSGTVKAPFSYSNYRNATLYVLAGSVDKYNNSSHWNDFKDIVAIKTTLNKTKANLEKTKTMTLKATVLFPDKSVKWKSSNTAVATVSSSGKVKGVKAGTATITCTSVATGTKATCKVTVGYVKLDKTEAVVKKGKTLTLTPTVYPSSLTDKSVTWKSSNTAVATVTSSGKVKGIEAGTATITCTSVATGLSTTCAVLVGDIVLSETKANLVKGKTLTLKATVAPSTLEDKSVTWKSSNTAVATVSTAGKVKGIKTGTATITCTSNATGLSTTCKVTVTNGIVTLDKSEAFVQKGKTVTLAATVTPSTLEDKSVVWESSDTKIATVTSDGKVKGIKYGTATITCTCAAAGMSATCTVTVGRVVISMSEFTLKKSREITLEATVYPTSLTDKSVTWESSNPQIATVSSSGRVKGIKAGTATITCTSVATGLKATCKVTVSSSSVSRSTEGDDDNVTGIEQLEENSAIEPFDVYDLRGQKVRHQVTSLDGLPTGIYIVNGKKMLKK